MNKWIAIPVIAVLAVVTVAGGYFLWQQTTKLGEAQAEIVTLEDNVSTLEGNVSTLQGKLTDSEAEVSDLEVEVSDLEGKASDLSSELEEKQQQLGDVQRIVDSLAPKVQMQQLLGEFSNKRGRTLLENPTLTHSEWRRFVMDEFRMDMAKYLKAVDDPALRVGYEKAIIWEVDGWHIHLEEFDKLLTFLSELIEVDINELQAALAD